MEVVLQWLDDLDDLVFANALASERARRNLLRAGLAAAVASALPIAATLWLPGLLVALALASVAAWSAGAAVILLSRRRA